MNDRDKASFSSTEIVVNVQDICRLCGSMNGNLVPIFENEQNLDQKIGLYLGFVVDSEDFWPNNICINCNNSLLAWHNFYKSCLKTFKKLQQIIQSNNKADKKVVEEVEFIGEEDLHNLIEDEENRTSTEEQVLVEEKFEIVEEMGVVEYSLRDDDNWISEEEEPEENIYDVQDDIIIEQFTSNIPRTIDKKVHCEAHSGGVKRGVKRDKKNYFKTWKKDNEYIYEKMKYDWVDRKAVEATIIPKRFCHGLAKSLDLKIWYSNSTTYLRRKDY